MQTLRRFTGKPSTNLVSVSAALLFVLIFGSIGIHYLTNSHAATPQQSCTISPILVNPCRPWIGAAAKGNPGTPTNQLPASEVNDRIFQFSYLSKLLGHQLEIVRDYHSAPGGSGISTLPL